MKFRYALAGLTLSLVGADASAQCGAGIFARMRERREERREARQGNGCNGFTATTVQQTTVTTTTTSAVQSSGCNGAMIQSSGCQGAMGGVIVMPPPTGTQLPAPPMPPQAPKMMPPPGNVIDEGTSQFVSATNGFVGAVDAIAEVNAARAQRGLRPFIPDPGLTAGAMNAAQARASMLMTGHLSNDFAMLPPGVWASAGGCAAWSPGSGWGSCCTYENFTFAGAAWAMGRDGRRFMHLFVR